MTNDNFVTVLGKQYLTRGGCRHNHGPDLPIIHTSLLVLQRPLFSLWTVCIAVIVVTAGVVGIGGVVVGVVYVRS